MPNVKRGCHENISRDSKRHFGSSLTTDQDIEDLFFNQEQQEQTDDTASQTLPVWWNDLVNETLPEQSQQQNILAETFSFTPPFLTTQVKYVKTLSQDDLSITVVATNGHRIILRDQWTRVALYPGCAINVVYDCHQTAMNSIQALVSTVDAKHNLLIVNPELLVPVTVLCESFGCRRRPVLAMRYAPLVENDTDEDGEQDQCSAVHATKLMIVGSIAHDIYEDHLMKQERSNSDCCWEKIDNDSLDWNQRYLKSHWEDIWVAKETPQSIMDAILQIDMVQKIIMGKSPSNATIKPGFIEKVIGAERTIYSPVYGLKGKLDLIIQTNDDKENESEYGDLGHSATHPLSHYPLELKTGYKEDVIAHRAQTMLYALISKSSYGYLLFLRSGRHLKIQCRERRAELVDLICARNRLICDLKSTERNYTKLPPRIENEHVCSRCPQQAICYKLPDHVDDLIVNSDSCSLFNLSLWLQAIADEESTSKQANLLQAKPIHKIVTCTDEGMLEYEGLEDTSDLILGDPVLITCWRRHGKDFNTLSAEYGACMGFYRGPGKVCLNHPLEDVANIVSICVQRDDMFGTHMISTYNLWRSVMAVAHQDQYLCHLLYESEKDEGKKAIVEEEEHMWTLLSPPLSELVTEDGGGMSAMPSLLETVSEEQTWVIRQIMEPSLIDFRLVHGMPGTGKSTTIAHLILCLAEKLMTEEAVNPKAHSSGSCLLLVAHTHLAVDNVLIKILDLMHKAKGIDEAGIEAPNRPVVTLQAHQIKRLVSRTTADRVHKSVAHLIYNLPDSFEELERVLMATKVFACTSMALASMSSHQKIFSRLCVRTVIVDEAAQMNIPSTLAAIRLTNPKRKALMDSFYMPSFVLIGDPCQLRPLTKFNGQGAVPDQRSLLSISLFEHLWQNFPSNRLALTRQWRMNSDIQSIANELFYGGAMMCGSANVASQRLKLKVKDNAALFIDTKLPNLIAECTVLWLDLKSAECKQGDSYCNPGQVTLVKQVLEAFDICSSVAILTPFRPQLSLFQQMLLKNTNDSGASTMVECSTIDAFQGLDKQFIILSLVRSNPEQQVGILGREWRRINVAMTRAKSKLLIVGDLQTITTNQMHNTNIQDSMDEELIRGRRLLNQLGMLILRNGWHFTVDKLL